MPNALQIPEFPRKLYYKINEVAAITGLKPHVLRYWETEFPALNPEKDGNDQRRYREKDIELVFQIKRLLHDEGYTIKGARAQLKQSRQQAASNVIDIEPPREGNPERSERLNQLRSRVRTLRRELSDLNAFLQA
ncbi:MerR family transcriptional regulator [Candidatus Sumerlaeota bacterium]|nr:MerR family transcriptional regulator [Candidatus Sumerlaeota bacterium]